MLNDFQKLFGHLQAPEPRPELLGFIIQRISAERLYAAKRRLVIFSLGMIGSLAGVIPAFMSMRTHMAQSGFAEFFSLLFFDAGSLVAYWQSFALTLLESLPAVSIAAFLATIFVFISSLRFVTRDIKILFSRSIAFSNSRE